MSTEENKALARRLIEEAQLEKGGEWRLGAALSLAMHETNTGKLRTELPCLHTGLDLDRCVLIQILVVGRSPRMIWP